MNVIEAQKTIKPIWVCAFLIASLCFANTAFADTFVSLPGCPDVLAEGSSTVFADGKPVGRVGDRGVCASVAIIGSETVFFNGKPALRVGDQVRCQNGSIGYVRDGESSVSIEGRPLATAASRIVGCE